LRDQVELAKNRKALAAEQSMAARSRLHAGLATPADLRQVREVERRADVELARLQSEDSASVASLVAAVGLRDQPLELQTLVYDTGVLEAGVR
jgi:outer membrane protein TolC